MMFVPTLLGTQWVLGACSWNLNQFDEIRIYPKDTSIYFSAHGRQCFTKNFFLRGLKPRKYQVLRNQGTESLRPKCLSCFLSASSTPLGSTLLGTFGLHHAISPVLQGRRMGSQNELGCMSEAVSSSSTCCSTKLESHASLRTSRSLSPQDHTQWRHLDR